MGHMAPTRGATVVAILLLLGVASPRSALYSQSRAQDADQFIQLGKRLPTLPPGEGGDLLVTAPAEFCTDAAHELRLNYFPDVPGGPVQLVLRQLAGPSRCQWTFDGFAEGNYEAVIQVQRDGRIVAMAQGQVWRGGTAVMTLASAAVEIEGRVTEHGVPMPEGLSLVFRSNPGVEQDQWTAPLDGTGAYRVIIPTDKRVCVQLQRTAQPLNSFGLWCRAFASGLQRFDIDDLHVPPGVLRIDVSPRTPVTDDWPDAFARIHITKVGESGPWITTFKVVRGLRGDYFAQGYGDFLIDITSREGKSVMASSRITLSPEQPVADFKLAALPAR
jgi:hypothetical protein